MSDYSIYPNALDGYAQLPLVVDTVTRIDAITVNRLRSAIYNIEKELGISPKGDYTDVRTRIDTIEAEINAIDSDFALNSDLEALEVFLQDQIDTLEVSLQDQIDALETILGYKNPARVATTVNVNLAAAPNTLDGISLAANDRILVHKQNDATQNGIYYVSTLGTGANGVWVRTTDADSSTNLLPGSEIFVVEGNIYNSAKFWLVTAGPYILGTTELEFIGGLTVMQSDSEPTVVLEETAIGASFAAATETDSISVRNFKEIDFSFEVGDLASITDIRIRVLYSLKSSPGAYSTSPEDWNIFLSEDIDGGLSTADVYTLSLTPSDYPGFDVLPGSFSLRAPISGLHMMLLIWSGTGSPVGSEFIGYALRRI